MRRTAHILLAAAVLLLLGREARAQTALLGVFQSPKGIGLTAMLDAAKGKETNILTLRTDFYGFLSGRTRDIGACLVYTHDYYFYRRESEGVRLALHAGAGGMVGYAHDHEKGFFSSFDRQLDRGPGFVVALTGQAGVRLDFRRHITVDLSFSACPGIHLRSDSNTGAMLLSFFKSGIYCVYYPQINIMYRFR
jgi:hypothetical protein